MSDLFRLQEPGFIRGGESKRGLAYRVKGRERWRHRIGRGGRGKKRRRRSIQQARTEGRGYNVVHLTQ